MNDECDRCGGSGYVQSGLRTTVLKIKDGVILKRSSPVRIQMPCPKCAEGDRMSEEAHLPTWDTSNRANLEAWLARYSPQEPAEDRQPTQAEMNIAKEFTRW